MKRIVALAFIVSFSLLVVTARAARSSFYNDDENGETDAGNAATPQYPQQNRRASGGGLWESDAVDEGDDYEPSKNNNGYQTRYGATAGDSAKQPQQEDEGASPWASNNRYGRLPSANGNRNDPARRLPGFASPNSYANSRYGRYGSVVGQRSGGGNARLRGGAATRRDEADDDAAGDDDSGSDSGGGLKGAWASNYYDSVKTPQRRGGAPGSKLNRQLRDGSDASGSADAGSVGSDSGGSADEAQVLRVYSLTRPPTSKSPAESPPAEGGVAKFLRGLFSSPTTSAPSSRPAVGTPMPAKRRPRPQPKAWRQASIEERRRVVDFAAALDSWRAVQQKVYYSPPSGPAYNEAAAADNETLPIVMDSHDSTANSDNGSKQKENKHGLGEAVDGSGIQASSGSGHDDAASSSSSSAADTLSTFSANPLVVSLQAACGADSKKLCDEADPFMAATCLQLHRANLSPLCAEYHAAKMVCFLDVVRLRLCMDAAQRYSCLEKNKFDARLSNPCTKSRFMRYLRSPRARAAAIPTTTTTAASSSQRRARPMTTEPSSLPRVDKHDTADSSSSAVHDDGLGHGKDHSDHSGLVPQTGTPEKAHPFRFSSLGDSHQDSAHEGASSPSKFALAKPTAASSLSGRRRRDLSDVLKIAHDASENDGGHSSFATAQKANDHANDNAASNVIDSSDAGNGATESAQSLQSKKESANEEPSPTHAAEHSDEVSPHARVNANRRNQKEAEVGSHQDHHGLAATDEPAPSSSSASAHGAADRHDVIAARPRRAAASNDASSHHLEAESSPSQAPQIGAALRHGASSAVDVEHKNASAAAAATGSKRASPAAFPSFLQACGNDAFVLCQNRNPFLATACLQLHREALSPLCRSYHDAKMRCYADLTRLHLCGDSASASNRTAAAPSAVNLFACLSANRNNKALSPACRESKFLAYIQQRPLRSSSPAPVIVRRGDGQQKNDDRHHAAATNPKNSVHVPVATTRLHSRADEEH